MTPLAHPTTKFVLRTRSVAARGTIMLVYDYEESECGDDPTAAELVRLGARVAELESKNKKLESELADIARRAEEARMYR